MRFAEAGISGLLNVAGTLLAISNQHLARCR
jgi:hypothetical protein